MNQTGHKGFTVIELMIVVTVMSILLAISLPGFQSTIERMTTNSQAKTLLSALNYARSEAIKRRAVVTVCASASGADCSAGAWGSGWLVYVDNNDDATGGAGSVDAGDEVLRVYTELGSGSTMTYPSAMLQYDSQGFGLNVPTTPLQRFLICPESDEAENAQAIDISMTGRASRTSQGLSCA